MVLKPVYLLLFSLSLLAVIAASGAVMVLAGKGQEVMLLGAGVGVGMSIVSALSLELWQLLRRQLESMQKVIVQSLCAARLGEINPSLFLSQYASARTPQHASEIHLEIECRRLLDRMGQLLARAVDSEGRCAVCGMCSGHSRQCPVPAAQQLFQAGKARRVPWCEYKKQLPEDAL